MKTWKALCKITFLFLTGGATYVYIEFLWRGYSHISMFILGGLAFILVGQINEFLSWDTPIWLQCLIGTTIILVLEFIFGCVLNLWLQLNIWDYSHLPFNVLGQICLQYAVMWYFLSALAIIADDYLRYWLFGEEKPHYCWHFKKFSE